MRSLLVLAGLAFGSAWAVEPGEPAPAVPGAPRGVVLYVDFWASWCVPCRQSMPALDALYRKHGPAGFAVVGVNKDVSAEDAKRFVQRVPVTFPLVADDATRWRRRSA
jgi:thiol-disulfide isomerase/thioredoxin